MTRIIPVQHAIRIFLLFAISSSAVAGEKLRIVTFNTEFLAAPGTQVKLERFRFDASRERHCEAVAAIIETLHPDVINLCEVINGETVEHIVKILHEKGLTDYKGYHIESNDSFTGQDVAFITRLKPDEPDGKPIRNFFSSGDDKKWRESYAFQDERGVARQRNTSVSKNVVYYFTVGGRKLGFLGLHLKSNPDDIAANAQRTAETKVARKIIREEIAAKGYTPIVLGDLNDYDPDVPDQDESRSTKTTVLRDMKDYDPAQQGPELVNVAGKIVRQADRFTSLWDRNENRALDPYDVQTMIDHILLHKDLMPSVKRAFVMHVTGLDVADHRPLVVDLELE